jgi:hypothetical protein
MDDEVIKKKRKQEYNKQYKLKKQIQTDCANLNVESSDKQIQTDCAKWNVDSPDELNCVDMGVVWFLYGEPINFHNINSRIPVPISKHAEEYLMGDFQIPFLQRRQTEERLIQLELKEMGVFYSELPKLISTQFSRDTMPGAAWDRYIKEYDVIKSRFNDAFSSDEKYTEHMNLIVIKNMEFLIMLHEKFGLTHEEYMDCVLTSFASDELYIPFNTPEEIIRCALEGKK